MLADGTRPRPVILVIDDSPDFRNLMRAALVLEGYEVVEAADGREGLRRFDACHPDLLLLDIIMPEKDGIETLREILRRRPGTPVITLSGRGGACEHNETAQILGAVASFRKPFQLAEVLGAIRDALAAPGLEGE